MSETRTTYDHAAAHLRAYVQPLWHGALAMPFDVRDDEGRALRLADDHLSGRDLLLVFLNGADEAACEQVLSAFARRRDALEARAVAVVAFNADCDAAANRARKRRTGFVWPLPGDATGAIFAAYGLHKGGGAPLRIVWLTPYRQVRAWYDTPADIDRLLEDVMTTIDSERAAQSAPWQPPHAPVLAVPNVLTPEECAQLIDAFETGGPFTVRPPQAGEMRGDYKIPVYDHNRQDRVDHIIKDRAILQLLDQRIFERIAPMIKKAFAFEVTRREDLHIARYVGARSGNVMGHRDNVSPATAYRRFALSLNLNDDYDGGAIVFKEFSPTGYRSPAGTALVFSSALLHEVEETTRGTRYTLISHFFNEQTLPQR